jgi:hypothetical protein
LKITRKQLKELISEQINNKKEYPELQKIAKEIAINVGQQINQKVKNVKSEMPYKAQHVLEELIKILQKAV